MNVEKRIHTFVEAEMSADGEVLIPDALRRAAGLVPGMPVVVGLSDRGEAVLMTRTQAKRLGEDPAQRRLRIRAALDAMTGRFSTGQSTSEIMEELRGDRTP
jgi:antitoxin PrlF